MDFWADLSSFATAAGTIAMAVTTYLVIRQSKRQHRDRLRPLCVLVPFGGVDPLNKRGELLATIDPSPDNPSFGTLAIKCVLRNVGTGPALNLRLKIKLLDMDGWTTEPWELAPLSAGETRGSESSSLLVPVRIHEKEPLNFTDFSQLTGKLWEIWLEYQDVFGQHFCSVHHKRPIRVEESRKPIPRTPDDADKRLIATPQAWITVPKCRALQHRA
jgi:hypothetical protein